MKRPDETDLGQDEYGSVTVRFGEATPIATLFGYARDGSLVQDLTLNEEMLRRFTSLAADWCRRNPPADNPRACTCPGPSGTPHDLGCPALNAPTAEPKR